MCIHYLPAPIAKSLSTLGHEGVSCAGTMIAHIILKDGRWVTITRIRITGATSVFFPLKPKHVDAMRPCDDFPCVRKHIRACMHPYDYITYVSSVSMDDDGLKYRSLGAAMPPTGVKLEPLEVFKNTNGSSVATLKVAPYVKDAMTAEERHALSKPMVDTFLEGLGENALTLDHVLGAMNDEETAIWELIDFLHVASAPGCHILNGILAEGSNPEEGGFFTFLHVSDAKARTLPMLGMCHGDQTPMQTVEDEDIFFITNHPSATFVMATPDEVDEGFDVTVSPLPMQQYIQDGPTKYAQAAFQSSIKEDFMMHVNGFLKKAKIDAAPFNSELRMSNLTGYDVPRNATEVRIAHDPIAYNTKEAGDFRRMFL